MKQHITNILVATTILGIVASASLTSCHGSGESADKVEIGTADTTLIVKKDSQSDRIPYTVANNYFVKNTVDKVTKTKIESQQEFEEIFGAAATMADGGLPTKIDFGENFVIPIVLPVTEFSTNIEPISLVSKDGHIEFTYSTIVGEKTSYKLRPFVILVVSKVHEANVVLNELS